MNVGKLGPCHRNHFAGAVQLHRTRAKWNHAVRQRQVAAHQLEDVSQEFGFTAIRMEYWVSQEFAGAGESRQIAQTLGFRFGK